MTRAALIAMLAPADTASDSNHGTGDFMPENLRGRDEAVLNFLDVGAADSAGGHANQRLAKKHHGLRANSAPPLPHAPPRLRASLRPRARIALRRNRGTPRPVRAAWS